MTTQAVKLNPSFDVVSALDSIKHSADQLFAAARVNAVFGEPIVHGDTLVVPSAELFGFMGFGLGFGRGPAKEASGEAGGGGGGGAGRVFSRPVALIVLTPQGVRVEPIVDVTKLALAGITAFGFVVAQMLRMSNRRRALKPLNGHDVA